MKTKYMSKGGPMKRGYAPVKKQTFKEAFAEARKKQGAGGTFTFKGKKYSTNRADDKKKKEVKKSSVKVISSKTNPLTKFSKTKKENKKTPQGTQIGNMAQQTMGAEDNIKRQIKAARKKSNKIPSFQPFKKGGKISDGTNFVARQYGGKIGK